MKAATIKPKWFRQPQLFKLFIAGILLAVEPAFASGPLPTAPSCPANYLPVWSGSAWNCTPTSDPAASQEQQVINSMGYVETLPSSQCSSGNSLLMWPSFYSGGYGISSTCVPTSQYSYWSGVEAVYNPALYQYQALNSYVQAAYTQQVAAQAAAAAAAALAQAKAAITSLSRRQGNNIGAVLCTTAKWFTGNLGKGLAASFMSILGLGVMLGKVSFKPTLFVLIGTAVIFGAPSIVNAIGDPYDLYTCGTTKSAKGYY